MNPVIIHIPNIIQYSAIKWYIEENEQYPFFLSSALEYEPAIFDKKPVYTTMLFYDMKPDKVPVPLSAPSVQKAWERTTRI